MKACVFVTGVVNDASPELLERIAMSARTQGLEGYVAKSSNGQLGFAIALCGAREKVDLFLDELYALGLPYGLRDVTMDPFVQDKDYRGAFRVMV